MSNNLYFSAEEQEILARMIIFSVREIAVADGSASYDEFAPLSYSISNYQSFPLPIVGEVLGYVNEKGPDYVADVVKEINDNIDSNLPMEILDYGKRVINNLHKRDKEFFLSGFYGLMLETVHADGHQDEEETAVSLFIMRTLTNLTIKDIYKIDRTWRKKARKFGY